MLSTKPKLSPVRQPNRPGPNQRRRSTVAVGAVLAAVFIVAAAACSTSNETSADNSTALSSTTAGGDRDEGEPPGRLFPDVIEASAQQSADGTWQFSATLSSPYDSPERYADAWRIMGLDGTVYGTRELAHDHGAEQPFTRSLGSVAIPADVELVTIEGRDQVSGWGGQTVMIELQRKSS